MFIWLGWQTCYYDHDNQFSVERASHFTPLTTRGFCHISLSSELWNAIAILTSQWTKITRFYESKIYEKETSELLYGIVSYVVI